MILDEMILVRDLTLEEKDKLGWKPEEVKS